MGFARSSAAVGIQKEEAGTLHRVGMITGRLACLMVALYSTKKPLQDLNLTTVQRYSGSQVENVGRGGNVSMEPTLKNSLTQAPTESRT